LTLRQQHIFLDSSILGSSFHELLFVICGAKMSLQWLLTDFLTRKNVRKWTKRFEESDEETELEVAKIGTYMKFQYEHLTGKQCFAAAMYAHTVASDLFAILDRNAEAFHVESTDRLNARFHEFNSETKAKIHHVVLMHYVEAGDRTNLHCSRASATLQYDEAPDDFDKKLSEAKDLVAMLLLGFPSAPSIEQKMIRTVAPQICEGDVGIALALVIFQKNRENFNELLRQTNVPKMLVKTTEKCGLCEATQTLRLECCGQTLCGSCLFNVLEVDSVATLHIKCPFCRDSIVLDDYEAKQIMSEQCPSHAKVMKNLGTGQSMVVYHLPCDEGRYDRHSKLRAMPA